MKEITVERLISGTLMREGAGVKLHRYIGADRTNEYDPFLLFDYFKSSDPLDFIAGFPPHPHRGFETITYLFEGQIKHEDNKGHKGVIGPGDVQWMTAGKGIVHSEMPSSNSNTLHGLQLWLNLPAVEKMCTPRYQDIANAQFTIEKQESGVIVKVIAGKTDSGMGSPISGIATKPLFLDIQLPANTSFEQHIPKEYQALIFVISGTFQIKDQVVAQGKLAALSAGEVIQLTGLESGQCLLIAASKLHEPVVRYGPFVMNTQEEVMQAFNDFRNNMF